MKALALLPTKTRSALGHNSPMLGTVLESMVLRRSARHMIYEWRGYFT
ncbi:MAG: hypothetical protein ACUVS3_08615 [Thermodesulfobacteriota bacterium]